jgi:hypothetical protein
MDEKRHAKRSADTLLRALEQKSHVAWSVSAHIGHQMRGLQGILRPKHEARNCKTNAKPGVRRL